MTEENRANITGALWFFSAIVLAALFMSAAAMGELTTGHIVLALVMLALVALGTYVFMPHRDNDAITEKAKRQSIDQILHNMSDSDLRELKQRLARLDGTQDAQADEHILSDDGELIRRQ